MLYRQLGRTGLKVSALCLGTMTFGWSADESTSHAILDAAMDAGINFIDTADVYSRWVDGNKGGESETIIGNWLKQQDRRQVVLATKVRGIMWLGPNGQGLSRMHIMQAVEDSLRRLQTDYIDLYQVHYPDDETPLDETLAALDDLVRSGKVRYVGASNYPAWLLMKSLWISEKHGYARFDCLQPHHSLLHRQEWERELQATCVDQAIGVIPYSPLAAGFLTGKYKRHDRQADTTRASSGLIQQLLPDDRAFDVLEEAERIAAAHGVPVAQVALAWQLSLPGITSPIIGARRVDQLKEVLGAVDVSLAPDEIERLNTISAGY
ncbi:MAG: aldo/keto reductase [Anaerolineae bacterium]|nr:aldo/keto reductase [Anaerolineae bacterium]